VLKWIIKKLTFIVQNPQATKPFKTNIENWVPILFIVELEPRFFNKKILKKKDENKRLIRD
jgi:hypothetical protein